MNSCGHIKGRKWGLNRTEDANAKRDAEKFAALKAAIDPLLGIASSETVDASAKLVLELLAQRGYTLMKLNKGSRGL